LNVLCYIQEHYSNKYIYILITNDFFSFILGYMTLNFLKKSIFN